MSLVFELLGWTLLLVTLPGSLYLLTLTLASLHTLRPLPTAKSLQGRLAIVVPAHDEAAGIAATLDNLRAETRADSDSEIVVVADNCSDATAAIAYRNGARVLERNDPERRGKGYALDFAFTRLLAEGIAGVVVIDADSRVEPGFLAQVRAGFGAGAEALQARYTVLNGNDSNRTRLAEIALAAYNQLRLRGRQNLGLSVGILGNGFALRRDLLERVPYSATSVVEDMEYHLKLLALGIQVHYLESAEVRGEMPSGQHGRDTQVARWEGGRLQMARSHIPVLVQSLLSGRGHGHDLDPLLDLLLPPLAYQVLLLLLTLGLAAGSLSLPLAVLALTELGIIGFHVLVAVRLAQLPWRRLAVLLRMPLYLVWKLGRLPALLASRSNGPWIRTDRTGS